MNLSGSVKLSMENLNRPELALSISGTLRGQGSVDQLSVTVSGSGNARLADIAMKQLTVKISGSGNVSARSRGPQAPAAGQGAHDAVPAGTASLVAPSRRRV
jgi:hypothetical protein